MEYEEFSLLVSRKNKEIELSGQYKERNQEDLYHKLYITNNLIHIYIYIRNNLLIALIMRNNELILRTVSKKEYRW